MQYVHVLTFQIEKGRPRTRTFTEVRVRLNTRLMPYKKYVEIRNGLDEECKMRKYELFQIRLIEYMLTTIEDDEAIPQDTTFYVGNW